MKTVNAMSIEEENVHYEYLRKFYEGEQERHVVDSSGNDVTSSFIEKTKKLFYEGKTEEIFKIMGDENLVLHLISEEHAPQEISTYAYDRYKVVKSDMIEFILSDQNDNTTIYVQAELSGGIWYNEATSEVTNVSNATYNILSIDHNGLWEVLNNDFKTGSSVVNGKGYFWGECHFYGQGVVDNTYDVNLDFEPKEFHFMPFRKWKC